MNLDGLLKEILIMTQKDKELLLKDLSARLSYGVKLKHIPSGENTTLEMISCLSIDGNIHDLIENFRPYLRPMSSMTKEEKEDLLITLLGKNDIKYFKVLQDGSIDNNDATHQDLSNFNIHWINFDGVNASTYIDWLNKNKFDYRGLIPKGLALEVTNENNPYKET